MAYQALSCPSCGFENHTGCPQCFACAQDLSGVGPSEVGGAAIEDADPTQEATAPPSSVRDRVRATLAREDLHVEEGARGWAVVVPLPEGRRQRVHVIFGGTDQDGDEVVAMLSPFARYDPGRGKAVLTLNGQLRYCCVAVAQLQGQDLFLVRACQPVSASTEESLAKALAEVARTADRLEAEFGAGQDVY